MTLNDIKKEVAHLGFESESAIDSSIESATRRALSTIYTEHGVKAVGSIYQNLPKPLMHVPVIVHSGAEDKVIELNGRTYTFVVSGAGEVEIKDKNGTRTRSFDTTGGFVHGRVVDGGELRFKGEFRYTVYDLCVYEERFAEGEAPPTFGKWHVYDLANLLPDFLYATSDPTDPSGAKICGASILSGNMTLPYEYVGEAVVRYRKSAPEVSINEPDKELDIPRELKALVSLLTAAYVWLDDDAEKAQYYMSLYRDGMSAVKLYTRSEVNTKFSDATGWAR